MRAPDVKLFIAAILITCLNACSGLPQNTPTQSNQSTVPAQTPAKIYSDPDFSKIKTPRDIIRIRKEYLNKPDLLARQKPANRLAAKFYRQPQDDTNWSALSQPALEALNTYPLQMYAHYILLNYFSNKGDVKAANEHERILSLLIKSIKASGNGDIAKPFVATDLHDAMAFLMITQQKTVGERILFDTRGYMIYDALQKSDRTGELNKYRFRLLAPGHIARQLGYNTRAKLNRGYAQMIGGGAQKGDSAALVGAAYLLGLEVNNERRVKLAFNYLAQARKQGNIYADEIYAQLLLKTLDKFPASERAKRIDEAIDTYLDISEKGDADAYAYLVNTYTTFRPNSVDGSILINILKKASAKGSSFGSILLSECYRDGKLGVTRNSDKSLFYLELASKQGLALAKARYANIVIHSNITYRNKQDKARRYLMEAVEADSPAAITIAYSLHRQNLLPITNIPEYKKRLLSSIWKADTVQDMAGILWILISAPEKQLQDLPLAINMGKSVMAKINEARSNPYFLDVLSIAYSQSGDLDSAIQTLKLAITSLNNGPVFKNYGTFAVMLDDQMEAYKSGRPLNRQEMDRLN